MLKTKIKGGLPSQLILQRTRSAFLAAFVAFSTGSSLWAVNTTWDGSASTDWNTGANWDTNSVPGTGDTTFFNAGADVVINTAANSSATYLGYTAGTVATITLASASWATINPFQIGANASGSGAFNVTGGTFTNNAIVYVSTTGGSTGALSISGGASTVSVLSTGPTAFSIGVINVSGGSLTVNSSFTLGDQGSGTLNLVSGSVTANSGITVANTGSYSSGTVNIGTGGAYTATLGGALTGGTGTGGARLNFNHTGAVSFGNVIAGSMIVTKLASGVTTLTGANTYTGGTLVSVGTLLANSANSTGAGVVTVASGARLGGSGTIAGSVTADGKIAAGNIVSGVAAAGQLNVGGNVTWNGTAGNAWEFQLNGASFDKLVITGNLIKGTGTTFQFDFTGATAGTYQLATFNSSTFAASDFSYTNLGAGLTASFAKTASALGVTITASAVPEPSTVATIAGAVILGYVVVRRRKTTAAVVV